MGGKRKLNLQIQCEAISEMEKSIFSEIGSDGLRFIKDGLHIGPEGIATITGEHVAALMPISKNSLQVGSRLGKGAACVVQSGVYLPLNIPVAIKTINTYDRNKRHQLMNDIRVLLGNLIEQERNGYKCNFLVTLYAAYFQEGTVKVILQLMDAGSLQDIIQLYKMAEIQPKIDEGVLAKIALQILCGLSYLHSKNHMHRDIKPANILLNSKGEVKLSDFGIAKQLVEQQDFAHTVIGTLSYKSPQRMINRKYGFKSDVWGLGLILFELACGQFPLVNGEQPDLINQFKNQQVKKLPQYYSKQFQHFIDCMLQIKQEHRWTSSELLGHPWLLKSINSKSSVKKWLKQLFALTAMRKTQ